MECPNRLIFISFFTLWTFHKKYQAADSIISSETPWSRGVDHAHKSSRKNPHTTAMARSPKLGSLLRVTKNWNSLVQDLSQVEQFSISRWLQYLPTDAVQIHGFVYASNTCQNRKHNTFLNLTVAKNKVARIQTISLPRLELTGAVLFAILVKYVITSLKLEPREIYLWTDSSITLGRLSKPPSVWET